MTDKSKLHKKIIILLFIILICLPHLIWILFGGFFDTENYENTAALIAPTFRIEAIDSYPGELEQYYNSRLPFRNQLIRLYSRLQYRLFHSSMDDQVIPGKEGWLFYNSQKDGETMGGYSGRELFTEEDLALIAANLETARLSLADRSCEFVLFIAPDKERVYPEYMPDHIRGPMDTYRTRQLIDYLSEHTGVRVVYPLEQLLAAKEDYQVFYRLDSHWNRAGGYIGTNALLNTFGVSLMDIDATQKEMTEPTICDLANILNLGNELNTDPDMMITGFGQTQLTNMEHNATGLYIYENPPAPLGKLFMVRDSFADSMDVFLASAFRYSYMPHAFFYNSEQLEEVDPELFVLELVERRLDSLKDFRL